MYKIAHRRGQANCHKRTVGELERDSITDVVDGYVSEETLVGESAEDDHLGLANAHRSVAAARNRKIVRLLLR